MSPQGGYEVVGEKAQSPLRAIFRKYAERNGYPVRLAEAMVSEEMEVRRVTFFDGTVAYLLPDEVAEAAPERGGVQEQKVVERADQLLTMHAREAFEFGFCGPPVKDRAEAYARLGFAEAQTTVLAETWAERASRFLLSIKSILFLLGIVALWMELKAPGFGIPGIIALVAFALFFSASAIAGISGELEVVIFVAGVGLLALEILVIPGFGLAGVAGIGCILVSLYMGSVKYAFPGGDRPWDTSGLSRFLLEFGGALLGAIVAAAFVARLLPKTPIGRRLILAPAGAAGAPPPSGAAAVASLRAAGLVGRTGTALTTLRPAGRIEVDGEPYDAVTEGGWIDRGCPVRVYKVEGNSIVVKKD
jgi:membrane-bound serine protease (ClpP class)